MIPNLKPWVAAWRRVYTVTLDSPQREVVLPFDFAEQTTYRLLGLIASTGAVTFPSLVANDDISAAYSVRAVSMVDGSPSYNHQAPATARCAQIGPGFPGNGDISASEQVILDTLVTKTAAGFFAASNPFTNGSGAGDLHFINSKWNSAAEITKLAVRADVDVNGVWGTSFFSPFAVGSRFDLFVLNNAEVWTG
ncbi:hypothetical protein [Primorskyibacter sedentarius]|uniref:hypothetical protein n=1 Tax=Primorskyibacter sedentarius TaxID=745311 RepID=UPI003EBAE4C6